MTNILKTIPFVLVSAFCLTACNDNDEDDVKTNDTISDNYESLLSGNKCWTMMSKMVLAPEYGDVYSLSEIRLEHDTVIDGIPFKRKEYRTWTVGEQKPEEWTLSHEYIGQKDGKVYLFSQKSYSYLESPCLVMDFSADVNSVVTVGNHARDGLKDSYTVTSVSNEVPSGSEENTARRSLHVQSSSPSREDVWIEGVGSLQFGLSLTVPVPGAIQHLYNCVDGDKVLYRYEDVPSIIRGDLDKPQ